MLTTASVLYIDPIFDQKLTFDGKEFDVKKNKQTFIASRVSYNDIIIYSFKVNANTGDDELKTMVEIKMYEEAGLDLQKKYKITYIKKNLDFGETILIEAFAIEEQKIKDTLKNVLRQEKYIDFLALPFFTFSTLYKNKILAPQNDLFVYIGENEAFLTIYKDGIYISTKSTINLQDIIKKLKTKDLHVTISELQKILLDKGLDGSMYQDDELLLSTSLQSIFVEIFNKINDILLYNRNVFGLEKLDRIFVDVADARVRGLRVFFYSLGYSEAKFHDFRLLKNSNSEHSFSSICLSYAYDKLSVEDMLENVTFFARPPLFLKTQVGKLSLLALGAVVLFSLYPLYLFSALGFLQNDLDAKTAQYEAIKKNAATFNAQLARVKTELISAQEIKAEQDKSLQNIAQSVDELYAMKLSSQMYVDFISKVNILLKKHTLMVRSIEQKGANKMNIEVVAKQGQRDSIAKFMEDLIAQGFIGVNTREIRSDKALYISKIEIER